jgi:hypothetical protein
MFIDRLGKVPYWAGCFGALQFAVATAFVALRSANPTSAVGFALLSFNCWVWGWFTKYLVTDLLRPALRRKGDGAPNSTDPGRRSSVARATGNGFHKLQKSLINIAGLSSAFPLPPPKSQPVVSRDQIRQLRMLVRPHPSFPKPAARPRSHTALSF